MSVPSRRIGIDVGGTNIDVVLPTGTRVLCALKTPMSADVIGGFAGSPTELVDIWMYKHTY